MLRAIAIVMVLVWHNSPQMFRIGWVGVDLFFILSGFLIGSILFSGVLGKKFSYLSYAANRLLRIYPLYIFSILIYLVDLYSRGLVGSPLEAIKIFCAHAVFLQTMVFDIWGVALPFYQVTWSLVVEVIFYATIPFILVALIRYNSVWGGLVCMVVGFIFIRFYFSSGYLPNDNNWQFYLFLRPYYRYDELVFGVAVACAVSRGLVGLRGVALPVGMLILLAALIYIWTIPGADRIPSMALLTRDGILMPSILALGFALVVYAVYDRPWSFSFVNIVARLAYPLYLMHMFVLHQVGGMIMYLVLSFVVAMICSYLVEYPFIRMYKVRSEKQSLPSPLASSLTS